MSEVRANPGSSSTELVWGSGTMFDRIARRYDLLNRLLSFGIDRRWREAAVRALPLEGGGEALDLATGTADLALRIATRYPEARVVGLDPSLRMLERGVIKAEARGLSARLRLEAGDACALPYEDARFRGVTMAFGIRNIIDRPKALREMARVTHPEGRIAILELCEPRGGLLSWLARFHVRRVVPWLGGLLSGSAEYRYLQRSMAAFPPAKEFAALMESCGLEICELRPLTFGVCTLFVARPRPASETR